MYLFGGNGGETLGKQTVQGVKPVTTTDNGAPSAGLLSVHNSPRESKTGQNRK